MGASVRKVNRIRQNVFPCWQPSSGHRLRGPASGRHRGTLHLQCARSAWLFVFLMVLCDVLRLRRRRDFAGCAEVRPMPAGSGPGRPLPAYSPDSGHEPQQKGLETTTSGKAGFITALYIVIVPVMGLHVPSGGAESLVDRRGDGGGIASTACASQRTSSISGGICILL